MANLRDYPVYGEVDTSDQTRESLALRKALETVKDDSEYGTTIELVKRFARVVRAEEFLLFGGRLPRAFLQECHGIDPGSSKDWDFLIPNLEELCGRSSEEFGTYAGARILDAVRDDGWEVKRTRLEGGIRITPRLGQIRGWIDLMAPWYYIKLYGDPNPIRSCFRGFPFTYQRILFDPVSERLTVGEGAIDSLKDRVLRVGNVETLEHEAYMSNKSPRTIAEEKAASLGMSLDHTGIVSDDIWEAQKELNIDYYLVMHPHKYGE